ncbi:hypothetical protein QWA_17275 [Alcaligenes faecalis subsp. faecalis NCIB 8687]|nr:hypothetical protein QWA_17275 [Alcaligenes faecalis subsp. faecalis NCIB 8687]
MAQLMAQGPAEALNLTTNIEPVYPGQHPQQKNKGQDPPHDLLVDLVQFLFISGQGARALSADKQELDQIYKKVMWRILPFIFLLWMLAGSCLSALLRRRWKLEGFESPRHMLRAMTGGTLMGVGRERQRSSPANTSA